MTDNEFITRDLDGTLHVDMTDGVTPEKVNALIGALDAQAVENAVRETEEERPLSVKDLTEIYCRLENEFHYLIKPQLDKLRDIKQRLVAAAGIGHMFQGPDGVVYQIAEKRGQWVDFTPFEITRTRRPGESKGSLSLTAARDAGFEVEGK